MNSQDTPVNEILQRIRERANARRLVAGQSDTVTNAQSQAVAAASADPRVGRIHYHLALCRAAGNTIGLVNPRPPGIHNELIQFAKKLMVRILSWYSRPLKQFYGEVVNAIAECVVLMQDVQVRLGQFEKSLQSEIESRNEQLETLSQKLRSEQQLEATINQQLEIFFKRVRSEIPAEWLAVMDSHRGPKAAAHLWFNEPIAVRYDSNGTASWSGTTERIIEKTWVVRNLSIEDQMNAKILDVGCTESTLSLELASNNFLVTGIDVRDYPLEHPNLQFVRADIRNSPLGSCIFDAVIALSTVEHIGLGAYGDPHDEGGDRKALDEIFRVLKPGGRLLLTVPFGRRGLTPLHRIYDRESLTVLLSRFQEVKLEFGRKLDERTWISLVGEQEAANQTHNTETGSPGAVAMAVCLKPIK